MRFHPNFFGQPVGLPLCSPIHVYKRMYPGQKKPPQNIFETAFQKNQFYQEIA
jgi:hypothetical protein